MGTYSVPRASRVLLIVGLLVLAPVAGVLPGTVHAAAGDDQTFAVAQGTECTVVAPAESDTDTDVVAFYDYRNNRNTETSADTFSSHGTTEYQTARESALLFYAGPDDTSMVIVHGELGGGEGGSTVTYEIGGLPDGGEWAVQDDDYESRSDDWSTSGDVHEIDWVYAPNRTDGGAYRGFDSLDGTTVIEPRYNEEAEKWGTASHSGSDDHRVTGWTLYGADGAAADLSLDRRVFVHPGDCAGDDPSAALDGPGSAAPGERVTLDASGTTDDGTIAGYEWDLDGDDETDRVTREPTLETTFEEAGERTVTVTPYDTYGNAAAADHTVTVGDAGSSPTADLSAPAEATVNETVTLDATGSSEDGEIVEYRWDVDGDGEVDEVTEEPTLETSYDAEREYTPTVTVVDDANATATDSATVSVTTAEDAPPTAELSAPAEVETNETVTFDASASSDDGEIVEYHWDVDGDGEVDERTDGPTTTHTYADAGEYAPEVTVVDDANATGSDAATVTVTEPEPEPPVADLTAPETVETNATVTLDASGSTDPDGRIVEYHWDLDGDGAVDDTTTGSTLETSYNATGDYDVAVTVVDDTNATATDSATVTVAPANGAPEAALTAPEEATVGEEVTLDASGTTDDGEIVEYRWDVDGDGTVENTTADATLTTSYPAAGEYAATVTAVDDGGRTATAARTVTVVGPEIVANDSEIGVNDSVSFRGTNGGEDASGYSWRFGDGTTANGSVVNHTFAATGDYTVTLRVALDSGTVASSTTTVSVTDGETDDEETGSDSGSDSDDGTGSDDGSTGGSSPPPSDGGSDDDGGSGGAPPAGNTGGGSSNGGGGGGGGGSGQADDPEPEPEPDLSTATVELDRRELVAGETLVVNATVNNSGDAAGTKRLGLTVDGDEVASREFRLAPGESRTVRFTHALSEPGTHTVEVDGRSTRVEVVPAEPDVSVADVSVSDRRPTEGERVTFVAVVENTGTAAGNASVSLELFNETVDAKRVRLAPGESARVEFDRSIAAAGEYTAVIGGRSVTVSVQPAQSGSASDTSGGASATGEGSTTSTTTPGFGAGLALVALAGSLVALLARRRSRAG